MENPLNNDYYPLLEISLMLKIPKSTLQYWAMIKALKPTIIYPHSKVYLYDITKVKKLIKNRPSVDMRYAYDADDY